MSTFEIIFVTILTHMLSVAETSLSDVPKDDLPAENANPVLVQLLYRHGVRSPLYIIPGDEDIWPQGANQLTYIGRRQLEELGEFYRNRYIRGSPYSFLSAEYKSNELYVRSSDVDRTLTSAYSNLAGMYPGQPCDNRWQPIPVHTRLYDTDFPLGTNSYHHCPKFVEFISTFPQSEQFKNTTEENREFLEYISNKSGVYSEVDVGGMGGRSLLHIAVFTSDAMQCRVEHDLPIPNWAYDEWNSTITVYEYLKELYYVFMVACFGGDRIPLTGGPLVGALVNNIKMKLNGSLQEKMLMFSGHESTLASFLLALDLDEQIGHIPFASTIMVELLSTTSGPVVQLLFRGLPTDPLVPLRIGNCSVQCPLREFVELAQTVVPDDWDKECGRTGHEFELNLGFVKLTKVEVIAILISLIVLLLLLEAAILLLIFYCRKEKLKRKWTNTYQPVEMDDMPKHSNHS